VLLNLTIFGLVNDDGVTLQLKLIFPVFSVALDFLKERAFSLCFCYDVFPSCDWEISRFL